MREGRFKDRLADPALRFSESVSFDRRLAIHDIVGSQAHVSALVVAGILTAVEGEKIRSGLAEIQDQIEAGSFSWDTSLEDVHMNIEAALTQKIGEAGAKLHTARSRNDQVALDLRLYVKAEIARIDDGLADVQRALLDLAAKYREVVMPGYTHLQRAQPIYFAHYLLGQIEAFGRDRERLRDCFKRVDVLPLGSGALAGSTIVLDRELIAKELGFGSVSQNSLDAVSDRDFVAEFLFCLAMIGTHFSRVSEDFVLWSTMEFGFIEISEAFSTGSSLMPQKRNPDMAELTRGKTGRLYGDLMAVLTILKGLPSTYNRDLQEDKPALFDAVDTVNATIATWVSMLPEIKVQANRMEAAAGDPALLATDLAEYLVGKGMPFRESHAAVGRLVRLATEKNMTLNQLPRTAFQEVSSQFGDDVEGIFDVRASLSRRTATGAPSPENVAARLEHWRLKLSPGGGARRKN